MNMKPKFYIYCILAIIALLLGAPVRSVFGADILYEDDFTNLDRSWGTPGAILSVKEGKLVLKPAPNTTQSVLNQSNVFDDADIEVEVILSSGDPIVPAGLIFWGKDYSNFYCFSIDANGSFKVGHFVIDRWLTPVGWTESPAINKGIGQSNKLRVLTKGRQATSTRRRLRWYIRRFSTGFSEHVGVCESAGDCHRYSCLLYSCSCNSPSQKPGSVAVTRLKFYWKRVGPDALRRFPEV
jgi:hypothetical protein